MPRLLLKLVQEQSRWISLEMHVLVSHHFDDMRCKTGLCINLKCIVTPLLNFKVTQSYLPRVVKPTPPPQDKRKTAAKETKNE